MLDLKLEQENETDVNMKELFDCYSEQEKKEFAQDFDNLMEDMINQAKKNIKQYLIINIVQIAQEQK